MNDVVTLKLIIFTVIIILTALSYTFVHYFIYYMNLCNERNEPVICLKIPSFTNHPENLELHINSKRAFRTKHNPLNKIVGVNKLHVLIFLSENAKSCCTVLCSRVVD